MYVPYYRGRTNVVLSIALKNVCHPFPIPSIRKKPEAFRADICVHSIPASGIVYHVTSLSIRIALFASASVNPTAGSV